MNDPKETFTINTNPYTQTFGLTPSYAGRWVLIRWQWGFIAINTDNPTQVVKKNGAWTPKSQFMTGTIPVAGDCHQSVANHDLTTSWFVAPNQSAPQCHKHPSGDDAEGLQVWGGPPSFPWKGLIEARVRGNNLTRIVGDYAYVKNGTRDEWFVFSLIAMTVSPVMIPTSAIPPWTPQLDIDGFTYNLTPIHPVPPPVPYLGPQKLRFDREGDIVPEPELPKFCPDKLVPKKQVAAMLYNFGQFLKLANPTLNIIVPEDPHAQNFSDVPPDNIFAPAIDALAHVNIVAGVPEGQPCD